MTWVVVMKYTVKQLSALCKVSVRTLHWYDQVGLLKPAHYGSNGYRYYEIEQVELLRKILFFKDVGFSFDDIKFLLNYYVINKKFIFNKNQIMFFKDLGFNAVEIKMLIINENNVKLKTLVKHKQKLINEVADKNKSISAIVEVISNIEKELA